MEGLERLQEESKVSGTYCVAGATGYIGSCLVEALLERGYKVHATVRDPEKSMHFLSLWTGGDRLRLFRADLFEEGSFDEAVKSCEGVFHVAASMEFSVVEKENIDTYVQENIIDPAVRGTLNILKACLKSKSVKKVVFTSSISTITAKDTKGKWRPLVDESCQNPIDQVWNTKASGWVYVLSKLFTEEAAFKFAKENGIELVSVITATVSGKFFTAYIPSSVKVLLSPITGEAEWYQILSAVNSRMGSVALVDIEDICNAHIFMMEHAEAEGRYICCAESCLLSKLVDQIVQEYPSPNAKRIIEKGQNKMPSEISCKRLRDLGFTYKHGLEDIIRRTITCCVEYGYLPPLSQ